NNYGVEKELSDLPVYMKWNIENQRWEIFFNSYDGDEVLYISTVATYTNPPDESIGNLTAAEADVNFWGCNSVVDLAGDVATTLPTEESGPYNQALNFIIAVNCLYHQS